MDFVAQVKVLLAFLIQVTDLGLLGFLIVALEFLHVVRVCILDLLQETAEVLVPQNDLIESLRYGGELRRFVPIVVNTRVESLLQFSDCLVFYYLTALQLSF